MKKSRLPAIDVTPNQTSTDNDDTDNVCKTFKYLSIQSDLEEETDAAKKIKPKM